MFKGGAVSYYRGTPVRLMSCVSLNSRRKGLVGRLPDLAASRDALALLFRRKFRLVREGVSKYKATVESEYKATGDRHVKHGPTAGNTEGT